LRELRIEGLSRRFGRVAALDDVSLTLRGGEVHALMGENGAGKSTLIRLLAGLDRPDGGRIMLGGAPLPPGNPAAVRAAGLRFIHQELHAVPALSVAENMHLDHRYPRRLGLVDWGRSTPRRGGRSRGSRSPTSIPARRWPTSPRATA
jgi:ABC-type sugar transport system ATPase subunit